MAGEKGKGKRERPACWTLAPDTCASIHLHAKDRDKRECARCTRRRHSMGAVNAQHAERHVKHGRTTHAA